MSFVIIETETNTGKCGSGFDWSSKESEQRPAHERMARRSGLLAAERNVIAAIEA